MKNIANNNSGLFAIAALKNNFMKIRYININDPAPVLNNPVPPSK